MSEAVFAFIAEADHQNLPQSRLPLDAFPPELLEPLDGVCVLPPARAVVAVQSEEVGVFVYRISSQGEFGGDTWHPSFDEAKHDIAVEFGGSAVEQWTDVPLGEDPITYVTEQVRQDP